MLRICSVALGLVFLQGFNNAQVSYSAPYADCEDGVQCSCQQACGATCNHFNITSTKQGIACGKCIEEECTSAAKANCGGDKTCVGCILDKAKDSSNDDILAQLDLASVGGQLLTSMLPLWKFKNLMKPDEIDAVLSRLPDKNGFGDCNRTDYEHKMLAGRSCARIRVGDEPSLQSFLLRVGRIFRADMSSASQVFVVRYAPGASGVPSHVDKYGDKSRNDVSLLVYLTTAAHPNSGLTVFEKAGVSVRPKSGAALVWMSSHINSEHALAPINFDEPRDRLVLQIGLNLRGTGDSFELPRTADSAFIVGDYSPDCASWCNVWTCSVWGCLDCPQTVHVCNDLEEGRYCAGWCNAWTSALPHCLGCFGNRTNPSAANQTNMSRLRGTNATSFTRSRQGLNLPENDSNGKH